MATTKQVGQQGEDLARAYLEQKGLRFLAANWQCKMGEIDLIMQQGAIRIFVEVRWRRPTLYGEGSDTVAWQKQRKLTNTAKYYQQKENYWGNIRFDVVSITATTPPQITHISHAFEV